MSKKEEDKLKIEIAKDLGLFDKVKFSGWSSLTTKESGKIGGIMSTRVRREKK